jgi:hypothetical protein
MGENSLSVATFVAYTPSRSDDLVWAHMQVVISAKISTICVNCRKRINGDGITHLKYHLIVIKSEVKDCKKVSIDVNWEMKQLVEDLIIEKDETKKLKTDIGIPKSLSNDEVK